MSNNTALLELWCGYNQLTSLDISNNTSLGIEESSICELSIVNMPTLEEVCVWTTTFPPEDFKLCADGSPNVYFTTACSK